MRRGFWGELLFVAALGCSAQVVRPAEDAAVADAAVADAVQDARAAPEAAACLPTGARCRGLGPCCVGFCDDFVYGYGPGRCVAPSADGEPCDEDRRCASGRCVEDLCRAAMCAAEGAHCETDEACCGGFCTASALSYAPGQCAPRLGAGMACEGPRWCASGRCVEGRCAP